jgi:hypothetical protein
VGEGDLYRATRDMMKRWLPQRYVSFKLNDMKTSGIPDMVVIANRVFSAWEFKYWDEDGFDWEGIQHLTACRLNREAYCRYAIYVKKTCEIHIVQPHLMKDYLELGVGFADECIPAKGSYDHYGFVQFLRKVHGL